RGSSLESNADMPCLPNREDSQAYSPGAPPMRRQKESPLARAFRFLIARVSFFYTGYRASSVLGCLLGLVGGFAGLVGRLLRRIRGRVRGAGGEVPCGGFGRAGGIGQRVPGGLGGIGGGGRGVRGRGGGRVVRVARGGRGGVDGVL